MSDRKVWPVILSGGSGTRLWPKSRSLYPKQFHVLTSEHSLLQEALLRVSDPEIYAKPMVICGEDHRFIVAEQADQLGMALQDIVLEPEARNTAAAVAVAAALVKALDPQGLVLILAADHHIPNIPAFTAAVKLGMSAAAGKHICTFGITPTSPETGYGYIKRMAEEVAPGVFKIDQFREKPDLETAKQYVADKAYAWNAGLFLFSATSMIEELKTHEPSIIPACELAIANGTKDQVASTAFLRLSQPHFTKAKAISIDFAVMEHTKYAAVIPLDANWTDVGSWPSLYSTCVEKAMNQNTTEEKSLFIKGDVHALDVKNSYLSTDGPLLAAIGIENMCVVATEDAVLVLPMDRSQDVGKVAKALAKDPRTAKLALKHKAEYKPWGSAKVLSDGDHYKVLLLTIKPGGATSLQMHHHRSMHQVVVEGCAMVTKGDEEYVLQRTESTYIEIGTTHRISNPGKVNLVLMEVQSGDYLGDDDIVRLDSAQGVASPTREKRLWPANQNSRGGAGSDDVSKDERIAELRAHVDTQAEMINMLKKQLASSIS